MSDIIETIDRLHAEATPGPWQRDLDRKCGDYGIGAAVPEFDGEYAVLMQPNCHVTKHRANVALAIALRNNWPAIRDRLREAERRSKAFDLIASGEVGIQHHGLWERTDGKHWSAYGCKIGSSKDLLTAIEAATREAKP